MTATAISLPRSAPEVLHDSPAAPFNHAFSLAMA